METIYVDGMTSFQPILVSAIYENILFGKYNMISFGHKDLSNSNIGKIHQ